ncbi:TetR/AcrR family transcriptional regulator [Anaerocolumna sp. MB42-C2]|uniref:TetR/AcrR family transcriptional regulator n=1 Tax=Anaerocolumna sp. MB42-C2 TaxID=3070997 RepID=UPI0027E17B01|nr:TetR/AcrR family transcriptional regulator [Anaerocolumna sp. MB42-C2]WMJ87058.1 TetR/AcrR family transcriptional regulator [Anaerocolumna sp. MB42-C2]
MNEIFANLEQEKQERIINAALKEFAQNGYDKASTNVIIKEAEIAKGSLFKYFNSKKELYLFLFDYVNGIINKIYDEMDWNETDLFERMKQIGLIKLRIYKQYPKAFDFLKSVKTENSSEVKTEIDEIKKEIVGNGFGISYKNIDRSKFRDDMDTEKIMNVITWTILSFAEQQVNKVSSFENVDIELLHDWDDYFDILKRCFYKEEEQ